MVHGSDFFICPVCSRTRGGCTICWDLVLDGGRCEIGWIDGEYAISAGVDD